MSAYQFFEVASPKVGYKIVTKVNFIICTVQRVADRLVQENRNANQIIDQTIS